MLHPARLCHMFMLLSEERQCFIQNRHWTFSLNVMLVLLRVSCDDAGDPLRSLFIFQKTGHWTPGR